MSSWKTFALGSAFFAGLTVVWADSGPAERLIQALKNSDEGTRRAVLEPLSAADASACKEVSQLARSGHVGIRETALIALGKIGCAEDAPLRSGLTSRHPRYQVAALQGIAVSTGTRYADTVLQLTGNADPDVAYEAELAFMRGGMVDRLPMFIKALANVNGERRRAGLAVLESQAVSEQAHALLAELLQSPKPLVRRDVIFGLRNLRARDQIPAIKASLRDPDPSVANAADSVLHESGMRAPVNRFEKWNWVTEISTDTVGPDGEITIQLKPGHSDELRVDGVYLNQTLNRLPCMPAALAGFKEMTTLTLNVGKTMGCQAVVEGIWKSPGKKKANAFPGPGVYAILIGEDPTDIVGIQDVVEIEVRYPSQSDSPK